MPTSGGEIRRTEPASRHGHRALPREECGCVRRQLDGSGPAAVRQRDAVDPVPAGGVCGQRVGVLERGHRTRIHVLFPAVHFAVRRIGEISEWLQSVCGHDVCLISSRQVYEAYRDGKVEEAMSFGFLIFLFSGDLTNFAGCYLTRQLPIQVDATIHTCIPCALQP